MKLSFVIFCISCFATLPSLAAECPAQLKTQQSLEATPAGWEPWIDAVNSRHGLESVAFYSGHPKELASLVPTNEDASDQDPVWDFDAKEQIWQACRYRDTKVQLIQKLPKGTVHCRVVRQPNVSPGIRAVECRK